MNKRIFALGTLVMLATSAGCIPGGGGGGGETLGQQVARHEQQLQRIASQGADQVLPGQAEVWSQMQTMRQDVNALQGKVDDLQRGGAEGGELAQLRERVNKQDALLRQMASQLAINTTSLDASGASTGGGASSSSSPAPVDTATAMYSAGIKSFDQSKYKDAVVSFKDFSSAYPKHKLAADAHFWEGESYFLLKDYARAALAYQEVIEKFPGSSKMQASMLKQGIALQNAGKKNAAKERLNELVKRYPSSPEASRAKQILASK